MKLSSHVAPSANNVFTVEFPPLVQGWYPTEVESEMLVNLTVNSEDDACSHMVHGFIQGDLGMLWSWDRFLVRAKDAQTVRSGKIAGTAGMTRHHWK